MSARLSLLALLLVGCSNTTGGGLVDFTGWIAGPASGVPTFTNTGGWEVTLSDARLHVGAVYLNQAVPLSGAQSGACVLPGTYVAQVSSSQTRGAADDYFDLLSPELQELSQLGEGTTTPARTAQVWLNAAAIDAADDPTPIFLAAGVATRGAERVDFSTAISIGQNRALPPSSPALPGSSPICAQRIVSPIRVDLQPTNGGRLVVRVDPRDIFATVDFSTAGPGGVFADTRAGSQTIYDGVRAILSYDVTWIP